MTSALTPDPSFLHTDGSRGRPARPPEREAAVAPTVASDALLRGRSLVHIEHNGALYQLRATRLGKLILTK